MFLICFNSIWNLRPVLSRPKEDVPEQKFVGPNPARVVEYPRGNKSCIRCNFQRKTDVRPARGTEFEFEPATSFVRYMPVAAERSSRKLHLLFLSGRFTRECRTCPALAPCAIADGNPHRVPVGPVAHGAAHTSPFMYFRHHRISLFSSTKTLMAYHKGCVTRTSRGLGHGCRPWSSLCRYGQEVPRPNENPSTVQRMLHR